MIARSYHAPLADMLASGAVARVISAHGRALNLRLDDDQLVALVAPELGNGPGAVVMEARWPLTWRVGEVIRLEPRWAEAVPWAPPEPPPRVYEPALEVNLPGSGLFVGPYADLAAPGLDLLAHGHWEAAVSHLVGLGPGLTPAGDDALAGACVALHRARDGGALSLGAALRRVDPGATTPLSRHLLRWAAEGVAGEHHLAWLDSVLAGAPIDPRRLLAHGATSGADWATGALLALRAVYGKSDGVSISANHSSTAKST